MRPPPVVARSVARSFFRVFGHWSLPSVSFPADATAQLESTVGAAVDAGIGEELVAPAGVSTIDMLRWLGATRPVLFHGSPRDDLRKLSTVRASLDTRAFGNQQAVYATQDPVWATFFAVLDRSHGAFRGTRNGVSRVVGGRKNFGPRYFFSVNAEALGPALWRNGTVYVVGRDGFDADRRDLGVVDNAQWASTSPVKWLARASVSPDDFPFASSTFGFRPGENEFRTYARIRRSRPPS